MAESGSWLKLDKTGKTIFETFAVNVSQRTRLSHLVSIQSWWLVASVLQLRVASSTGEADRQPNVQPQRYRIRQELPRLHPIMKPVILDCVFGAVSQLVQDFIASAEPTCRESTTQRARQLTNIKDWATTTEDGDRGDMTKRCALRMVESAIELETSLTRGYGPTCKRSSRATAGFLRKHRRTPRFRRLDRSPIVSQSLQPPTTRRRSPAGLLSPAQDT